MSVTSIIWWVTSVVVVGILINLFSSYLKPGADAYLSSMSTWWKRTSEEQAAKRKRVVDRLRSKPHEQVLLALSEIQTRLFCLVVMVISVMAYYYARTLDNSIPRDEFGIPEYRGWHEAYTIPYYIFGLRTLSIVTFLAGIVTFRRFVHLRSLLREARTDPSRNATD